jgi:hypothetical protein
MGKRSHSGHDFHSRNQELIGTEALQTLRYIWFCRYYAPIGRLSADGLNHTIISEISGPDAGWHGRCLHTKEC